GSPCVVQIFLQHKLRNGIYIICCKKSFYIGRTHLSKKNGKVSVLPPLAQLAGGSHTQRLKIFRYATFISAVLLTLAQGCFSINKREKENCNISLKATECVVLQGIE
ncbi:MAG: hypothetical protein ACXVED_12910, partial [Bacteroidia bacterium]